MLYNSISHLYNKYFNKETFEILEFPFPYSSMMSINSDVEFTSWENQLYLINLFNDYSIETGFSFWCFCDPKISWRLFEDNLTKSKEFEEALPFLQNGTFDTIHSFGGVTDGKGSQFNRDSIKKALDILDKNNVFIRVYSNHGTVYDTQNIGGDWAQYQKGDVKGDPNYHLDLTLKYGVKFFWTDIDYDNFTPFFQLDDKCENNLFNNQKGRNN